MNDEERRVAAAALLAAEDDRSPIEPMSTTYPDADVDDAYRVSMLVTAAKVARGQVVKGQKIGLTSKAMQQLVGSTEPDFGTLFADWFVDEGATVARADFNRPLVEVELAFIMGQRLAGPAVVASDVIRATDFVVPSIEIVDTRYAGRGRHLLVDSISDAASCGRVILGACPKRLTDIDVRAVGAALLKNGYVEESGVASAVMGSPVNAVAWLANKLGEFGVALEPGDVVLSGSFVKAIPFAAGDTITASFAGFGDVTFHAS
ncbi:MAG: fumarylacetoacetate hydrolase family protein [Actinomycetota bacterium]|jgi:2-oxo-hept-3-ene-1,7-dioate hydratase/2-keto-4-pentenoate hydratase